MAAYYIGTYDIVDPKEFQKYPPVVMSLLPSAGRGNRVFPPTTIRRTTGKAHTSYSYEYC